MYRETICTYIFIVIGPSPYTSYYRTGCTTTNDPTAAIDANEQEFGKTGGVIKLESIAFNSFQ